MDDELTNEHVMYPTGLVFFGDLAIEVYVMETKTAFFGETMHLVRPVKGSGKQWMSNVAMNKEGGAA